jgi:hypothetical protein
MQAARKVLPSITYGFALCSPEGEILVRSYRPSKVAAIAVMFDDSMPGHARWEEMQAAGWSVEPVYVRMFQPVFYVRSDKKEETA